MALACFLQLIADMPQLLQGKLPQYMIPSHCVHLPQLPHLPSGKVNRKALPAVDIAPTDHTADVDVSPEDKVVLDIFRSVCLCSAAGFEMDLC